ncbi:hypothetical protein PN498_14015 [Oscillatoria sp. CS-180]|nr:hypothetical protein [Oscillatoria sp. CS-180]
MLKPAYKIILGRKFIDTTDEPKASTVVDLTVNLCMETPADSVTLQLGNVGGLEAAQNDEIKVELGYEDEEELTQVMVGAVVAIAPTLTTTEVVGHSAAATLLRTFVDQTYENKTAGDIVRDLVEQASGGGNTSDSATAIANDVAGAITGSPSRTPLEIDTAEDGITFPAYVIDSRRSAYHHMRDLADLCGFDLYINADGKLVFEKFVSGKTVHVFEYAKHIIHLEVAQEQPRAGEVQAWGESPGGSRGGEAWAWLTKDFSGSRGTAGSGSPTVLLERSPLRTADAARTAADAFSKDLQRRTLHGKLRVLGNPQVKLGDAIRLDALPNVDLNQLYQVRGITHRITKHAGFTTEITFRSF